ncbi:MAG TPA: endonuclease/exonuclease/phosphatase family protein [Tepidisphaeraceae bacterium]|jgi:endonuclease/exonuclease/phosphatase family metal-dependent hydrolase
MRIVSYNILDGGEGRADPLAEVIVAQRPDIVALVEADDPAVLARIASRLKMDLIHAPGNTHAVALLSPFLIIDTINHAPLRPNISKCLLEATVQDAAEVVWTVGVLHLHAHAAEEDEAKREVEIAEVLEVFAKHRAAGRPHLLMGDFNANAPSQEIDPEKCKPCTREEWQTNGGKIPRRVIQKMLDGGYLDTLAALHEVGSRTAGTFSTQFPGQRIDFIFSYGIDLPRLSAAWIERDRLAKYASDHFPIGVEIE